MFNIQIPVPDSKTAFERLASHISRLDWYIANNRANRLDFYKAMNNPLIDAMCDDRNLPRDEMTHKYLKRFTTELYDPTLYTPIIEMITSVLDKVQLCYPRFEALQNSWGFEIMPRYQIDLNPFSIGGQYHRDDHNTGHVIVGTHNMSKIPERWASLIVHEMLHLGIEDLIINPEKSNTPRIQQEEKERIVDNLSIFAMDGIIDHCRFNVEGIRYSYQPVAAHCAYMDKVVGPQPETNLVNSVQEFLNDRNNANPFGKENVSLLLEFENLIKGKKTALDIGCAHGAKSIYLADLGLSVTAIDSQLPTDFAHTNITKANADVRQFDFGKYDIILALNVLQFLEKEEQTTVLDKMLSALNPEGSLFIVSFTDKDPSNFKGSRIIGHFHENELHDFAVQNHLKVLHYVEKLVPDNHEPIGKHTHGLVELVAQKNKERS